MLRRVKPFGRAICSGLCTGLASLSTGVGGTNLYGVESHGVSKHKSFIINKLCFVISSLRGRWRFVPPKPATSGTRYPAEGRINRAAPYKSAGGGLSPHGCNKQIYREMTINPRGHPSDKVSKRIQLTSSSHPLPLRNDYCMPFHRVSA